MDDGDEEKESETLGTERWGYSTLVGSAPPENETGAAPVASTDRRQVLKYAGLIGAGVAGGAGAVVLTSDSAAATVDGTLDATDQSVSDDDGSLSTSQSIASYPDLSHLFC